MRTCRPSSAAGLALALACALCGPASAAERSRTVPRDFQRANPCPSTGQPRGACPGYVRDHVVPLCAGGPDHIANLQWQTILEGRAKDRIEVRTCRAQRQARN